MTVKNEDEKNEDQKPHEVQAEEEFRTPEDDAFDEAQRELEEAERAASEGAVEDDPDKAEAAEFEQVVDKTAGEDAKPEGGEILDKADDEKGKTVPLAVLMQERNESRARERELELKLARTEGALSAKQGDPDDAGESDPHQKSPEEQISELNEQVDELYQQADDGELTFLQARQKERELQDQIDTIKSSSAQQIQDSQPVVMDARIEENLVELETKYPIIKTLDEQQMNGFVRQAYQQAEEEGQPIRNGALETMRLHNMATKMAHDHYAQFYQTTQQASNDQPGASSSEQSSPNGQTSGKQGLSPQAQARANKIDLAAGHPPDINKIGSAAEGTLNDTQILAKMKGLSEEERIEFLDSMPGLAKRLGA